MYAFVIAQCTTQPLNYLEEQHLHQTALPVCSPNPLSIAWTAVCLSKFPPAQNLGAHPSAY